MVRKVSLSPGLPTIPTAVAVSRQRNFLYIANPLRVFALNGIYSEELPPVRCETQIDQLALSRDERSLAVSTNCSLKFLDVQSGREMRNLVGPMLPIKTVCPSLLSPYAWFSGSNDSTFTFWDLRCHPSAIFSGRAPAPVNCVQGSPDERILAVCTDGGLLFYDVRNRDVIAHVSAPTQSLVFNPCQRLAASFGAENVVRFWCLEQYECVSVSDAMDNDIQGISFETLSGDFLVTATNSSLHAMSYEPYQTLNNVQLQEGITILDFSMPESSSNIEMICCLKDELMVQHLKVEEFLATDSMKLGTPTSDEGCGSGSEGMMSSRIDEEPEDEEEQADSEPSTDHIASEPEDAAPTTSELESPVADMDFGGSLGRLPKGSTKMIRSSSASPMSSGSRANEFANEATEDERTSVGSSSSASASTTPSPSESMHEDQEHPRLTTNKSTASRRRIEARSTSERTKKAVSMSSLQQAEQPVTPRGRTAIGLRQGTKLGAAASGVVSTSSTVGSASRVAPGGSTPTSSTTAIGTCGTAGTASAAGMAPLSRSRERQSIVASMPAGLEQRKRSDSGDVHRPRTPSESRPNLSASTRSMHRQSSTPAAAAGKPTAGGGGTPTRKPPPPATLDVKNKRPTALSPQSQANLANSRLKTRNRSPKSSHDMLSPSSSSKPPTSFGAAKKGLRLDNLIANVEKTDFLVRSASESRIQESQQMTQRARMSGVGTMTKDALVSTYTTTMVLLKAINQKNQWDLNRAHLSLARVKELLSSDCGLHRAAALESLELLVGGLVQTLRAFSNARITIGVDVAAEERKKKAEECIEELRDLRDHRECYYKKMPQDDVYRLDEIISHLKTL